MLIVVQHEPGEGPGSLKAFLGGARIVRTFAGEPVPDECDALVVLGGGMGVYEQDRLPHLRDEIRLLHRCKRRISSDRKSTRLNSSHRCISYAVFCLKKKKKSERYDELTGKEGHIESGTTLTI